MFDFVFFLVEQLEEAIRQRQKSDEVCRQLREHIVQLEARLSSCNNNILNGAVFEKIPNGYSESEILEFVPHSPGKNGKRNIAPVTNEQLLTGPDLEVEENSRLNSGNNHCSHNEDDNNHCNDLQLQLMKAVQAQHLAETECMKYKGTINFGLRGRGRGLQRSSG